MFWELKLVIRAGEVWAVAYDLVLEVFCFCWSQNVLSKSDKSKNNLHSQGSYLLSKVHRQTDLNLKAHGATRHPCHDTWYLLSAFVGFYTVSTQWSCKKKRTELQIRHSNQEWSPNPGLMERHHLYRALRMQFGKERELSQMSHFKL